MLCIDIDINLKWLDDELQEVAPTSGALEGPGKVNELGLLAGAFLLPT